MFGIPFALTRERGSYPLPVNERFDAIDYGQAKQVVSPYIPDHLAPGLWSADFFKSITFDKLACL